MRQLIGHFSFKFFLNFFVTAATCLALAALDAVLTDLRRASPMIMRLNVRLTRQLLGRPFEEGRREAERVFLTELMATEDAREGPLAFMEKRNPEWKAR